MTAINNYNCVVCQDPISTGISYWIHQLYPTKHVRKLSCQHDVHTACFQKHVNRELSSNFDHRGPVPCPKCEIGIESTHSVQHLLRISSFLRGMGWGILTGVGGWGLRYLILAYRGTESRTTFAGLGSALIAAACALRSLSRWSSANSWLNCYNFYYGLDLQKKDLQIGMDIPLTRQQWLNQFYDYLTLYKDDEDSLTPNKTFFIKALDKVLTEKGDQLSPIIKEANKHYFQIINSEKATEFLKAMQPFTTETGVFIEFSLDDDESITTTNNSKTSPLASDSDDES